VGAAAHADQAADTGGSDVAGTHPAPGGMGGLHVLGAAEVLLSVLRLQYSTRRADPFIDVCPCLPLPPHLQGLKDRLDSWIGKVNTISAQLEADSIGVVAEVH
jgi:hypothetical protein